MQTAKTEPWAYGREKIRDGEWGGGGAGEADKNFPDLGAYCRTNQTFSVLNFTHYIFITFSTILYSRFSIYFYHFFCQTYVENLPNLSSFRPASYAYAWLWRYASKTKTAKSFRFYFVRPALVHACISKYILHSTELLI